MRREMSDSDRERLRFRHRDLEETGGACRVAFEKARATDGAEGWHQSVVPRARIEMIAVYAVSGLVQ